MPISRFSFGSNDDFNFPPLVCCVEQHAFQAVKCFISFWDDRKWTSAWGENLVFATFGRLSIRGAWRVCEFDEIVSIIAGVTWLTYS